MADNRLKLSSGNNDLKLICTDRGTHPKREIGLIAGWFDDNGELWLFDRAVASLRPNARRSVRSSPQEPIRATDETTTWRFPCPTCPLDMQLKTPPVAAMWKKAYETGHKVRDLNPPIVDAI